MVRSIGSPRRRSSTGCCPRRGATMTSSRCVVTADGFTGRDRITTTCSDASNRCSPLMGRPLGVEPTSQSGFDPSGCLALQARGARRRPRLLYATYSCDELRRSGGIGWADRPVPGDEPQPSIGSVLTPVFCLLSPRHWQPACEHGLEVLGQDRLADVVVHAGRQTTIAVALHRC